jgi:hypothetical protein
MSLAIPVITQPGVHSFESWRVMYKYVLDCMYTNIEKALSVSQMDCCDADADADAESSTINVNWEELRRRLERHVYTTSSSRFKRYHPIW